ncbi:HK97 family phage prohead protease [Myroides odoratimimus]|uniref:HK97 family phage prohead protease n=1 Tax=Myroides odoratimimus TaxID=76832 RepID=UPI0025771254|nr:HK97 family phage prohead protease [Myroides odoratimimus]MDM1093416.1 HK97 family phage prohead protease [Myroides odoratimimus]
MKAYVLNDENKRNNYGFRVLNAGISLERFINNPICLNDHKNNTKDVLGKWKDLKTDGSLFIGTPELDTQDVEGLEVVRKIKADIIVGTSMGFDFSDEDFMMIDGELVLTKCELKEVSFVAVPSNANTIVLYDQKGMALSKEQINELCLSAQNRTINKPQEMNKVIKHLQLSDNATETEVLTAVQALEGRLTAKGQEVATLKAEKEALIQERDLKLKAEFDQELEEAVKDGRLDEDGKAPIQEMVQASGYAQGSKLLKALPKRKTIADKLETKQATLSAFDKMSWSELDKGNHLGKLKADNPDYYKERFVKHFGKEPNQ